MLGRGSVSCKCLCDVVTSLLPVVPATRCFSRPNCLCRCRLLNPSPAFVMTTNRRYRCLPSEHCVYTLPPREHGSFFRGDGVIVIRTERPDPSASSSYSGTTTLATLKSRVRVFFWQGADAPRLFLTFKISLASGMPHALRARACVCVFVWVGFDMRGVLNVVLFPSWWGVGWDDEISNLLPPHTPPPPLFPIYVRLGCVVFRVDHGVADPIADPTCGGRPGAGRVSQPL